MMCSEMLGGAMFIAAAQKVFTGRFAALLSKVAPGIDAGSLSNVGATDLLSTVSDDQVEVVKGAYSTAVTSTFYLGTALSAASLLGAVFMEWRSIKKPNP